MDHDVDCTCANRFPILSAGFERVVLGRSPTLQDLRFSQVAVLKVHVLQNVTWSSSK